MVKHLGLKLTAKSSALLDLCLEIARQEAPLANVSVASFFMGLLDRHAASLGLHVETDPRGVPVRIMRQIVSPERSGRLRRETVEVWSNPSFKGPFGYEIIRGGHKNEGEP